MLSSVLLLMLSLLVNGGCSVESNYQYYDGFEVYMIDVHGIDVSELENTLFYLTPLDGCDYCVKQNLLLLQRVSNEYVVPVLLDYSFDKEVIDYVRTITKKYRQVLYDKRVKVVNYETGYVKPILIHIKNGKVVKYFYIEDDKLDEVEKYLVSTS